MEYDFNPEHESDLELVDPKDAAEFQEWRRKYWEKRNAEAQEKPEPAQTK